MYSRAALKKQGSINVKLVDLKLRLLESGSFDWVAHVTSKTYIILYTERKRNYLNYV